MNYTAYYLLAFVFVCLFISATVETWVDEDKFIKSRQRPDNIDIGDVMSDDDWQSFTEEN